MAERLLKPLPYLKLAVLKLSHGREASTLAIWEKGHRSTSARGSMASSNPLTDYACCYVLLMAQTKMVVGLGDGLEEKLKRGGPDSVSNRGRHQLKAVMKPLLMSRKVWA